MNFISGSIKCKAHNWLNTLGIHNHQNEIVYMALPSCEKLEVDYNKLVMDNYSGERSCQVISTSSKEVLTVRDEYNNFLKQNIQLSKVTLENTEQVH